MSRRFFSRGPLLCLGTILLVPVVVLYLTQVIWLESLSAPFPGWSPIPRPWGCSG